MIFKQLLWGSVVFVGLALTSCSDKEGIQDSTDQTKTDSTSVTTQAAPAGSPTAQPTIQMQPQPGQAQAPAADVKVAAGMNPAHGAPGHRCDIAVGAPLNSPAPAKGAAPQMQVQQQGAAGSAPQMQMQQAPPTAQPAAAGKGSGKINPAHGQPGHDCKVAVGAPLP